MRKAFTLIEIIIVVAIMGIMAAAAIPKLTAVQEQSKVAEAVSALETLHAAQLRYELEHPGTYTNNCALLDVAIVPKNYTLSCFNTGNVRATRIGGTGYSITQDLAGVFTCSGCLASIKLPS